MCNQMNILLKNFECPVHILCFFDQLELVRGLIVKAKLLEDIY